MAVSPAIWTSGEACIATGGNSSVPWDATGVSIDTRTLNRGDLFVALKGPNFDGHRFADKAFEAGASAVVIAEDPGEKTKDGAVLCVSDTQQALEDLARAARDRMRGKIIAVTGSVGKTSTKEMLSIALKGQGNISVSAGNLNNHWGLPLSLSRMPASTDFGVFEMGMNHPGEIGPLSKMARPHAAIITAIEAVHAAHFSSVDEIADAKAEIFEGVVGGGYAVLNQDNPYFDYLSKKATVSHGLTVCGFGFHKGAWARIEDVDLKSDRSQVTLTINDQTYQYEIGAPGEHLVRNSAAVLAALYLVGGNIDVAAANMTTFRSLKGRGSHTVLSINGADVILSDESYNASPASMRAALEVIGRVQPTESGRRIAVLGDMLELGDSSVQEHTALRDPLEANNIDQVFTCGPLMQELWNALPETKRGGHSDSPEKLALVILNAVRSGDVVMVKGSLGSRVTAIVETLMAMDAGKQTASDKAVSE